MSARDTAEDYYATESYVVQEDIDHLHRSAVAVVDLPPTSRSRSGTTLHAPRPFFYLGEESAGSSGAASSQVEQNQLRHGHESTQSTATSSSNSDPFTTPVEDYVPPSVRSFSQVSGAGGYDRNSLRRPVLTSSGTSLSGQPPASPTAATSPLHATFAGAGVAPHVHSRGNSVFVRDSLACPPPRINTNSSFGFPGRSTRANSPVGSYKASGLGRKPTVKRAKSTALLDLDERPIEKLWLGKKDGRARASYWITAFFMFLGACAGAVVCFFGAKSVKMVGNVCLVLDEEFNNGLDTNTWFREVRMDGFGNNEFEMTTNSDNNSFVEDGVLYIVPTLTSDVIGYNNILDGYTFNITGCTSQNQTQCGAVSNNTLKTVIPPVQSARLTTNFSKSIQYGRVEVRARLPRGDWLWPAIWMLPTNDTYGPWPVSGEIDIMEARGNGPTYAAQGINYVRSSLNWGPVSFINSVWKTYGWWTMRRKTYADDFHTYALEWTDEFLRVYVDSRLQKMLDLRFNEPFFERGDYPTTVFNGSQEIVLQNPWENANNNAAPFDQPFYLILNVAVGGTNGWFPDNVGDKPWLNGAADAMYQFAKAQDTWSASWPTDKKQRALAVDSVKMWQKC